MPIRTMQILSSSKHFFHHFLIDPSRKMSSSRIEQRNTIAHLPSCICATEWVVFPMIMEKNSGIRVRNRDGHLTDISIKLPWTQKPQISFLSSWEHVNSDQILLPEGSHARCPLFCFFSFTIPPLSLSRPSLDSLCSPVIRPNKP